MSINFHITHSLNGSIYIYIYGEYSVGVTDCQGPSSLNWYPLHAPGGLVEHLHLLLTQIRYHSRENKPIICTGTRSVCQQDESEAGEDILLVFPSFYESSLHNK